MTYNTHLYLGTLLFPVIREGWDVGLSKKRFLYGCVKPDITSLFVRHPHFWRISKQYIFRKINRLASKKLTPDKKNKKFSVELGVVLHYVADFFTAVHNIAPNRISEHLEFENRLFADFLRYVNGNMIRTSFRLAREYQDECGQTADQRIRTRLVNKHKGYRPNSKDTRNDIHEIIEACILVTCEIMDGATRARNESAPLAVLPSA